MLNFAEQTGSGAVIVVWYYLMLSRKIIIYKLQLYQNAGALNWNCVSITMSRYHYICDNNFTSTLILPPKHRLLDLATKRYQIMPIWYLTYVHMYHQVTNWRCVSVTMSRYYYICDNNFTSTLILPPKHRLLDSATKRYQIIPIWHLYCNSYCEYLNQKVHFPLHINCDPLICISLDSSRRGDHFTMWLCISGPQLESQVSSSPKYPFGFDNEKYLQQYYLLLYSYLSLAKLRYISLKITQIFTNMSKIYKPIYHWNRLDERNPTRHIKGGYNQVVQKILCIKSKNCSSTKSKNFHPLFTPQYGSIYAKDHIHTQHIGSNVSGV